MDSPVSSPHVLIFPLPLQGHIVPMLKLAELLCLANLRVTFLNSTYNHQRLTRHTNVEAYFARYTGFRLESIPDGLPDDHPRAGGDWIVDLIEASNPYAEAFLRDLMGGSDQSCKVTCLIVDTTFSFVHEIASEFDVPVIGFRVIGASSIWSYMCIPKLIQDGEIPFKEGEDMDRLITNVPGMETFLRRCDLPTFCCVQDVSDTGLQRFMSLTQQMRRAHAIILNTFDDAEGPALAHLQAQCPKIYTIGPLHAHLSYRLGQMAQIETTSSGPKSYVTSLWAVDRSCLSWLDQKPNKSVLYVSFGTLATLTRAQFIEFWAGLVESKKYFLWAVRPNLIVGDDVNGPIPKELLDGTEERGCMVGCAPQEEILAHPAVGGFLSQCGWNAVLEGLTAGVPMLCWPYFAEQQLNARYISEVWGVGLDMRDVCDRRLVKKMISDLMDSMRDELERSTATMSGLAKKSVTEGGSSYCNLEQMIEDIKAISKKVLKVGMEG